MKTTFCFTLSLLIFVTLTFLSSGIAQAETNAEYMIRLFHFVPNDWTPELDINTKIDTAIKDVQRWYADEMERHGFGQKTFQFDTNTNGNAVIHRIEGEFDDAHYLQSTYPRLKFEYREHFLQPPIDPHFINLVFVSISSENIGGGVCGISDSSITQGHHVFVPSSGRCFMRENEELHGYLYQTIAHELGHSFGLAHDYRQDSFLLSHGAKRTELSACAAEWLSVSPWFNTDRPQSGVDAVGTIKMLPPTGTPPETVHLRFEVSDPDGLHQAVLLTHSVIKISALGGNELLACQSLQDKKTATIAFDTTQLIYGHSENVTLQIVDENGNVTNNTFPIDLTTIFSGPVVISIPDKHLEAAIRTNTYIFKTPREPDTGAIQIPIEDVPPDTTVPITRSHMLRLVDLNPGPEISDLTGLEYAQNLKNLSALETQISDLTPLAGLRQLQRIRLTNSKITNLTPLKDITSLTSVEMGNNQISDITALAGLTQLEWLLLQNNQISDITALAGLTKLNYLQLNGNNISDVSAIAELVNLKSVNLSENPIKVKDREPLFKLLEKNPDVLISVYGELLPVNLSHFWAEHSANGVVLKWTTESEVDNAGFYIYRSPTKDGEFKVVNPKMIQGAGTTGERNEYTWTDTTAKPNTVYYYRIEDVSHAGERKQLATVRLRGFVSAKGKLTTSWANLKVQK